MNKCLFNYYFEGLTSENKSAGLGREIYLVKSALQNTKHCIVSKFSTKRQKTSFTLFHLVNMLHTKAFNRQTRDWTLLS